MKKRKVTKAPSIQNRRARFDYELGDEFVLGIVLSGAETKALRMGHGHLRGAYVILQNGAPYLFNATITPHSGVAQGLAENYEPTQNRKLLAKQKEIDLFAEARKQGLQIIPVKLLTQGRFIKVVVAIGRGRKKYDKREVLKKRDFERGELRTIKIK